MSLESAKDEGRQGRDGRSRQREGETDVGSLPGWYFSIIKEICFLVTPLLP